MEGKKNCSRGPIIRDVWFAEAAVLEKKNIKAIHSTNGPYRSARSPHDDRICVD